MKIKELSIKYIYDPIVNSFKNFKSIFLKFVFKYKEGLITFGLIYLFSFLILIYPYFSNMFVVSFGGDYYLQSMTFNYLTYDIWHDFFKTGHFPLFDERSFLGLNNIGANSFYFLFNPWYLITLVFPRSSLMFVQSFMFPFKLCVGGMGMYLLLKHFNLKISTARLFGIAYAFCGYSMMYYWFQFNDSICFFPFFILGIEKIFKDRDIKYTLVSLILCGLTNFFIMINFLIAGFMYAIFRLIQKWKVNTPKESFSILGFGFLSFLLPILCVGFILMPSIFNALSIPRIDSAKTGYLERIFSATTIWESIKEFFKFDSPIQHVYPLVGFLFMPVGCFYQNVGNVNYFDNLGQNTFISTPLTLIAFYSIVSALRSKKVSHIIGIILVTLMMFTPFCYYLFSMFTVGYSRFLFVVETFLIIFCAIYFDKIDYEKFRLNKFNKDRNLGLENKKDKLSKEVSQVKVSNLDIGFVLYLLFDVLALILILIDTYVNPNYHKDAYYYKERFLLIPLEAIFLIVCYILMRIFFFKKNFYNIVFILTSLEFIFAGNVTVINQGIVDVKTNNGGYSKLNTESQIVELLKENDVSSDSFYRMYSTSQNRNNVNQSLMLGYNGLGLFNSSYPFFSQDFLDMSRIPYTYHNWSMGYSQRRYNMDNLLGVKYYITELSDSNIPFNYVEYKESNRELLNSLDINFSKEIESKLKQINKKVYVNTKFIDTFFVFDQFSNVASVNYTINNNIYEQHYLNNLLLTNQSYIQYNKTYLDKELFNSLSNEEKESKTYLTNYLTSNSFKDNGDIQLLSSCENPAYCSYYPRKTFSFSKDYNQDNTPVVCNPSDNECQDRYITYSPTEKLHVSKLGVDNTYTYINQTTYPYKLNSKSKIIQTFDDNTYVCSEDKPCYLNVVVPTLQKTGSPFKASLYNINIENDTYTYVDSFEFAYSEYQTTYGAYVDKSFNCIVLENTYYTENLSTNIKYELIDSDQLLQVTDYQYNESKKVEILFRNSDMLQFTTNFDTDKIVLINKPYYPDFKLYKYETLNDNKKTVRKSEVPLFIGNGGFLSYIDKKNTDSSVVSTYYELVYSPKGLDLGYIMTIVGIIGLTVSMSLLSFNSYLKKMDKIYKLK